MVELKQIKLFDDRVQQFLDNVQQIFPKQEIPLREWRGDNIDYTLNQFQSSLSSLVSNDSSVIEGLKKATKLDKSVFDTIEPHHLFMYPEQIVSMSQNIDDVVNFFTKMHNQKHEASHTGGNGHNIDLGSMDKIITISKRGDEVVALMDEFKKRGIHYQTHGDAPGHMGNQAKWGMYYLTQNVFDFIDNKDTLFPLIDAIRNIEGYDKLDINFSKTFDNRTLLYKKTDNLLTLAFNQESVVSALKTFKDSGIVFEMPKVIDNALRFSMISKSAADISKFINYFKNTHEGKNSITINQSAENGVLEQIYTNPAMTLHLARNKEGLKQMRDAMRTTGVELYLSNVYEAEEGIVGMIEHVDNIAQLCDAIMPCKTNYSLLSADKINKQGSAARQIQEYIPQIKEIVKKLADNYAFTEPDIFFEDMQTLVLAMENAKNQNISSDLLVGKVLEHSPKDHMYSHHVRTTTPKDVEAKKYDMGIIKYAVSALAK